MFFINFINLRFKSASNKPHPLNNDFIIIYIIGGISSYEYKIVKDLFNQGTLSEKKVTTFNQKKIIYKNFITGFNWKLPFL